MAKFKGVVDNVWLAIDVERKMTVLKVRLEGTKEFAASMNTVMTRLESGLTHETGSQH